MPRSWWFKSAFVFALFVVAIVGLVPTYVELVAYPENPQEVGSDEDEATDEEPGSEEADGQEPTGQDEQGEGEEAGEATEVNFTEEERDPPLPSWYLWFAEHVTDNALALGLDLQGGLLLRYSVDVDGALDEKLEKFAEDMEIRLKEDGISDVNAEAMKDSDRIEVEFGDSGDTSEIDDDFMEDFPVLVTIGESGSIVTLGLRDNYVQETEEFSVKQAVEIIRERVDALGVASPSVRVEGGRHIVVELPGLSRRRAAAAERLISTTAVLRFKLVADASEAQTVFQKFRERLPENTPIRFENGTMAATDELNSEGRVKRQGKDILKGFVEENEDIIPDLRDVVYQKDEQEEGSREPGVWRTRLVRNDSVPTECDDCLRELTGDNVDDAFPASDRTTNLPYVSLKLDKKGGDTFYEITKQHVGDQLAILMDDTLVSDPVIRSEIPGGNVSIEMGGNNRRKVMDDVQNLVVALRSGALPAPIRQEFKTLVGPTLGRDSIERGTLALIAGSLLILIFMLVYYKLGGLIANVALLLNLVFILAIMASLGSALTLPGIAGIVLTVGMAVDANVIIFERVREEIRAGETPRKSIQLGYGKAYWTILDANITTGIAALVLMEFGSGPVRGFAVTLLIGIICSVFTAVFVTRLIFDLYLAKTKAERLPI